ncbi:protein-export chaperone SecB [Desulfotomaculum nigrificans]|uniref:protein-export chaperone SecB n=1 Tax=Desulfotomaculum nigrificans TaxID=1565 RepID=UPI0001FAEAEA|nr:protein-export chaperone SecB [Desulfotomaculum nigrificans]
MDNSIKSVLTFDNYIVKKILFEANPKFAPGDKIPVEVEFSHELDIDLKENIAAVGLGCCIFKEQKENQPFYLEVEMIGFFKYESSLPPEQVEILLKVNGTAILFPYLRSIVSSLTANSGFQTLVLPIVNVHKMFEQEKETYEGREEMN